MRDSYSTSFSLGIVLHYMQYSRPIAHSSCCLVSMLDKNYDIKTFFGNSEVHNNNIEGFHEGVPYTVLEVHH